MRRLFFLFLIFSSSFTFQTMAQQSTIMNSFSGLSMGNVYKLSNGELWEQTEAWTWAWSWSMPQVSLYTEGGVTKMKVQNIDHPVSVRRIKNFVESTITSKFEGLNSGYLYTLANGQVWKQTEAWVWVWIWFNPQVILWESYGGVIKMKVQGINHPVMVTRIR